MLGLRCCLDMFVSSWSKWGLLFIVVHGPLITVASLVVETGSRLTGSAVAAARLSCSAACEIFRHQGSNSCSLPWQVGS